MYSGMRDRGHTTGFMLDAISAIDIALWDLAARSVNQPVYKLGGGAFRTRIPVYASGLDGVTVEERVNSAAALVEQGFTALKLFLEPDVEQSLREVKAVRAAVGDNIRLLADAQWLCDAPTAIRLGRGLEELDVFWLETPVNPEDLAGQARVCAALDLAVASGECERTRYQFRDWLMQGAVDIIQPDVGRAGGITECRKIISLAQTFNVPCAMHLGVGLAVYIAASMQVAAMTPNLLYLEYQPKMVRLANQFLAQPLQVEAGALRLSDGPGLGVELDAPGTPT
jgi:L-alanine-DL-glutamate epimerase-like enolase superfamily enzyme